MSEIAKKADQWAESEFKRAWLEPKDLVQPFFHYCPVEAAKRICQLRCIFLTHYNDLDDKEETRRGIRLARQQLRCLKEIDRRLLEKLESFFESEETETIAQIYIGSFTSDPDNEYMWTNFAEQGKGGCLAIDPTSLLTSQNVTLFWTKVDYKVEQHKSIMRKKLVRWAKLVSRHADKDATTGSPGSKDLLLALVISIVVEATRLKERKFKNEREFRLVYIPDGTMQRTRTKKGCQIRYAELPVDGKQMQIQFVRLGANASASTCDSLRALKDLVVHGGSNIIGHSTTVP